MTRPAASALLSAALVLAYVFLLAAFSVAGFPDRLQHGSRMPYLSDKPLGEDAYYMIAIGWHLGTGRGFTYGGEPTTGTQPLMTLVYGAVARASRAAGGDRWTFARAALALNGVLFVAFWAVTYRLARTLQPDGDRSAIAATTAALTLLDYSLFRVFTYGLETGLYLLIAGACVAASLDIMQRRRTTGGVVFLGVLAGLAALARIDFLIVFAMFMGVALVRRRVTVRQCLAAGATAGVVTSPWFLWVHHVSGRWMPSSGESQAQVIAATSAGPRLHAAVTAVGHHLAPWFYPELVASGGGRTIALVVAIALIAAATPLLVRAAQSAKPGAREILLMWAAAIAGLIAVYVVFFWPTYFYVRYSSPAAIVAIPMLAIGLASVVSGTRRSAILPAAAAGFLLTAVVTLHRGAAGNSLSTTARFIDESIARDVHVGAFSSGVSGYYFDNVTNLDGKVNAAAMRARREGRLGRYINESDISILVDWPETIEQFVSPDYLAACWQPCAATLRPEQGRCFVRRRCQALSW